MSSPEATILCRTPTPGKSGTRIAEWKFDLVRGAILQTVPEDDEGVEFRRLPNLVAAAIEDADRERLGSVSWYTTTVKLEMEVRGEIERIAGSRPQRLRRPPSS